MPRTLITTTFRCPEHPGSWRTQVREVATATPTRTVLRAIATNPPPCHCGAPMRAVLQGTSAVLHQCADPYCPERPAC